MSTSIHRRKRALLIATAALALAAVFFESTPVLQAAEPTEVTKAGPGSPRRKPEPAYPMELANEKLAGSAVIEVTVNKRGEVKHAKVVSATHEAFGRNARNAALRWEFVPFEKDGRRVEEKVSLPFEFSYRPLGQAAEPKTK